MRKRSWVRARWESAVDTLSFNSSVRELVERLNREMEAPHKLPQRLVSHPQGFAREISKRRLTIAERYLEIATLTEPGDWQQRLDALDSLVNLAMHAKTLSMPLNTARLQIALMKRCVESRRDRRRQLELMSNFALASHGQTPVIRRLLRDLDMVEVAEDGRQLREVGPGWDDHVHDAFTEGHETPCQLVLDAFIKGIARITVVYYDLVDPRLVEETIRAGEILGIDAEVGVEFSVGAAHQRVSFVYIPPDAGSVLGLRAFLAENHERLAPFLAGLAHNAESRRQVIRSLLDTFNAVHLRTFNAAFPDQPFLQLAPLRPEALEALMPTGQASRLHLGQLLWSSMQPVMHKRVLFLKNQLQAALDAGRGHKRSSWEVEQLRSRYRELREEYRLASPARLQEQYLHSRENRDYASAFATIEDVLPLLSACGGRLAFIHPLSKGLQRAVDVLIRGHRWLTGIEVFNMADAAVRSPETVQRLGRVVEFLNAGDAVSATRLLEDRGVHCADPEAIERACAWYADHPLRPRCGSDYVGGNERVPGMGFSTNVQLSKLNLGMLRANRHASLGGAIGRLLSERKSREEGLRDAELVYLLSAPATARINLVGDEAAGETVGLRGLWRHLNLGLKSLLKLGVGLVPATLMVGPGYALLWLGITGFRNILVDLISSAGLSLRAWRFSLVDKNNLANSLLWTGFSVPILAAAKHGFDLGWPLLSDERGFIYVLAKFWVIALANGLYIASHNKVRGFDTKVIRGNFFRTVLSWPLATVGSYGLNLLGIPAIVQAKIWSDVVAGVIEGSGKYLQRTRRTRQWMLEILLRLGNDDPTERQVARADLLVVWGQRHQGRRVLASILRGRVGRQKGQEHWDLATEDDIATARDTLIRDFSAEDSMARLTAVVLAHYDGEESAALVSLIARHHQPFRRWLMAQTRKPGPAAGRT